MAESQHSRAKYQIQVGDKFGRLTVTGLIRKETCGRFRNFSVCKCECGITKDVLQSSLFKGITKSCGCYSAEVTARTMTSHGKACSPVYQAWYSMKRRCYGNAKRDQPYRDRGIIVCERWLSSFQNFYTDVGDRPTLRHSIDRINNDGNYEPGNVRWALPNVQARNTTRSKRYFFDGKNLTLPEWSEDTGLSISVLRDRIVYCGWSVEKALTTPVRLSGKKATQGKRGVLFEIWEDLT